VVVRFDLERDRLAVAEVEDAGVLAWPLGTRSPSLEKRLSRSAECLYPQCSDQSSEKTASSKWFGSRSRKSRIRSSSPSVRPSARWRFRDLAQATIVSGKADDLALVSLRR
jgi:hypothetical protein